MYGVVVHFDEATELYIKKLWLELSERNISRYAEQVPGRRPHMTIASYSDLALDEFTDQFDELYRSGSRLQLNFSTLGSFIRSGALLLTPNVSAELVHFHQRHHEHFIQHAESDPLYAPGNWIPHCTIANRLSIVKLLEAFNYCTNRMDVLQAEVAEITLIRSEYSGNTCIGAPSVHSIILQ